MQRILINNINLSTNFLTYFALSSAVGSLLRPITLSISSCAFFWTCGNRTKYKKQKPRTLDVVSEPAMNKSTQMATN